MRIHSLTTPHWVMGALIGLPSGIFTALVVGRALDDWPVAVGMGVIACVLIGLLIARVVGEHNRRVRAAVGDLPAHFLLPAYRASRRGPVPADPEIRSAALAIATQELSLVQRNKILLLFPAMSVLPLLVNSTQSEMSVSILIVPGMLVLLLALSIGYQLVLWPRRLRGRVRMLS